MPRLDFHQNPIPDLRSPRSVLSYLGSFAIRKSLPGPAVHNFLTNSKPLGRILLLSIGKAAEEMASSAYEILKDQIFAGIILTKYGHTSGNKFPPLEILEAGHPIPDENSILGGKKILELCSLLQPEDTVLVLLSGGGSALMEVPAKGFDLEDLIFWNSKLLESGAEIQDVNEVRIFLSSIKGGGLLSKILPSRSITLILSDVIGDDLSKVASGPTIPSRITKDSILRIFKDYNLKMDSKFESAFNDRAQETIRTSKDDSLISQSADLNQNSPSLKPTTTNKEKNAVHCIGNIGQTLESVQKECKNLNIPVLLLSSSLTGEAKEVGYSLASIALEKLKETTSSLLILCGGETTVTHDGNGKGGRNQELALAFAEKISGQNGITLFSLATDGSDGPTDAAGAIVDGTTWKKIAGYTDPKNALRTHNSYEALKVVDSLVFTGATGTNVNDIQFLWIDPNDER
ncbi:DUF4147 domain-containing protein [Leptospira barantonii]|uniref:DUF4147 domain-containing protein n=1 Tax=Leptospira barantonii TaxID=2023184 RepID=A0A5F2AZ22_9LEPT|nr:DUF4147 domain-containing protein [Leptospira barantonii]TGL95195.1 DUF4147 domain-containing protein [Leptospira barantonii]